MKKIAILQPEVPHYRSEFFKRLSANIRVADMYVYNTADSIKKSGFQVDVETLKYIPNIKRGAILLYNPFAILRSKYDTIVLMLSFTHITTWILLLSKFIHRKKIILWGQGISVKRYIAEERNVDWKLKWMIGLSDGAWFYTKKELALWQKHFPGKRMVALDNTISGVQDIASYESNESKKSLRARYSIKEQIIFIFCARFESPYRRVDLLVETIKRLDSKKYGFVIIGDGKNKPDFMPYSNVYDFGAVYDQRVKQDLFSLSDIYYQPGWVGLSIVEAMAYGKPVFTFQRSEQTKQCVEYYYINSGYNGVIFNDIESCIAKIEDLSLDEINTMGNNARDYVKKNLTMDNMVQNALSIL